MVDENTQLTKEEEIILLTFSRIQLEAKLKSDTDKRGGFYSHLMKKTYFRKSQLDAGTVVHEIAHAYANKGCHDFITLMAARGMDEPSKLDEGMVTHIERIVFSAWHS